MSQRKRLALLASGGGTTVEAILRACQEGRLPFIEPAVLITDRPGAGAVARAANIGFTEHRLIPRKQDRFGHALLSVFKEFDVQIVGQYGWLSLTPQNTIRLFMSMPGFRLILNQHPSVTVFGGRGMWGKRPHAAVLKFAELVHERSGRVVCETRVVCHQVDEFFDHGEVLWYKSVPTLPGDTPATLQERALPIEWETQIEALERLSRGKIEKSTPYYAYPYVHQGEEDVAARAVEYALTTPT